MRIQEVTSRTGISKRNIYFYIKEGLLSPSPNANSAEKNNYYDFTETDCRRLSLIRRLRSAGFSIPDIRSLIEVPSSIAYYLNKREWRLKNEASHISDTLKGIAFIRNSLSLNPTLEEIISLTEQAQFPEPLSSFAPPDSVFDNTLINRWLWEGFMPKDPLNEYQEFLWTKINRITADPDNRDYRLLGEYFSRLDQKQIQSVFRHTRADHSLIIALTPPEYAEFAEKMLHRIEQFLNRKTAVAGWIRNYRIFLDPQTRIYDSGVNRIMAELSPRFARYLENVHAVCRKCYERLCAPENAGLKERLMRTLSPNINIDGCSHGQLLALAML